MRDGVVLRADVYATGYAGTPARARSAHPVFEESAARDSQFHRLAARGYVVVVEDTRGRYTSDGVARPHDEAEDGYDTIEWAAALAWVNGRIGTFGGSYLATTQLMAAPAPAPHLAAMFPSSSCNSATTWSFKRSVLSGRRVVVESGPIGGCAPPDAHRTRIATARSA